MDYIEKWPLMVIFLYNLYILGIHLWTLLYHKLCYNEPCYKEVNVYYFSDELSRVVPMFERIYY